MTLRGDIRMHANTYVRAMGTGQRSYVYVYVYTINSIYSSI